MSNPASLTMGFAGVHPRQLAPTVGTTQVGITISAVPFSLRARSNQPEEIKITTSITTTPSRPLLLQPCQDQYYGSDRVHNRQRRNRRPRRAARGLYEGVPLDELRYAADESPITRRPTAARALAARQDNVSEHESSDCQNYRNARRRRRPKSQARQAYNDSPLDESC